MVSLIIRVRLRMALDSSKLEGVAMQVDGVIVGAAVFEEEAIALASNERGGVGVWERLAVDEPVIEITVAGEFGLEDKRDFNDIGVGWRWWHRLGELEVVPYKAGWLLPLLLAGAACVLDDDAHAEGHDTLADFAENPDAEVVHLDEGADAFGGRERRSIGTVWD